MLVVGGTAWRNSDLKALENASVFDLQGKVKAFIVTRPYNPVPLRMYGMRSTRVEVLSFLSTEAEGDDITQAGYKTFELHMRSRVQRSTVEAHT